MTNDTIFNSKTNPIPELRRDLDIIPVQENGEAYLYFHDQRQFVTPDLVLRREAGSLLSLIDGCKSINDLKKHLNGKISKTDLTAFIRFLDEHHLLNSPHFKAFAHKKETEYEQSRVHGSVIAGGPYPADPDKLTAYLDEGFSKHRSQISCDNPKALYAPHIDPRVALNSYVEAFAPIEKLKPKRVIMLATSHYAGWSPELYEKHPFILVNKNFEMPLGTIRRDENTIAELSQLEKDYGISTHDRVHRREHSLELHLLFLSYLWNHDFTIIPFLVSGLQEILYMKNGYHGQLINNFSTLLRERFGEDEDTFFLISGDLAHFGHKFGDSTTASSMFEEVKNFDQHFLEAGAANDAVGMLQLMKKEMDAYRICGFPPLYTFLNSMPDLQGEIINYDLWDERKRESAVTFGSILYSTKN